MMSQRMSFGKPPVEYISFTWFIQIIKPQSDLGGRVIQSKTPSSLLPKYGILQHHLCGLHPNTKSWQRQQMLQHTLDVKLFNFNSKRTSRRSVVHDHLEAGRQTSRSEAPRCIEVSHINRSTNLIKWPHCPIVDAKPSQSYGILKLKRSAKCYSAWSHEGIQVLKVLVPSGTWDQAVHQGRCDLLPRFGVNTMRYAQGRMASPPQVPSASTAAKHL